MKPDKITCNNCGKEINKGKWCSDKCRMAFKRTKSDEQPEQIQVEHEQKVPEQPNPNNRDSLTKTDKTFYDRAMKEFGEPYYNFNQINEKEETCIHCKTKFKTRLGMLRYCSYRHYKAEISNR